jgi:hypothetical protein
LWTNIDKFRLLQCQNQDAFFAGSYHYPFEGRPLRFCMKAAELGFTSENWH